ncbi:MAG TPA: thiamine pyrophosphate-dependent enzyme, partial [Burkholderiaceae bacterium]|nr:thiamine pyrophosphate-dependent enzyme [Burkholderiaceae bacterium]
RARLLSLNVQAFDSAKWRAQTLVADARTGLSQLGEVLGGALAGWSADGMWTARARKLADAWRARVMQLTTAVPQATLPYDAEVIGAVRDSTADSPTDDVVVCAAGTLPAELHKLWRAAGPGNYHVEYGFSCMGYEIAGGLGVKMARPQQEVIVMVGDGSYMMMNSELATAVMLGHKLIVVVLDNRGYGCIHRLQRQSGGARFNNMLDDCLPEAGGSPAHIDFAAHAASMGAEAVHVTGLPALRAAMVAARAATSTQLIVIDTTAERSTEDGGCWWEVAIPEISARSEVGDAHARYLAGKQAQRI